MSELAVPLVMEGGQVLLKHLPVIIASVKGLIAIWKKLKTSEFEHDVVLEAIKLINQFGNNINCILEDLDLKEKLLKGLTLLVRRVSHFFKGNSNEATTSPPPSNNTWKGDDYGAHYVPPSSSTSSPSMSTCYWKECDLCLRIYNLTNREPVIINCGHTFCRECLQGWKRKLDRMECPYCEKVDDRPLEDLPCNADLLMALKDDENFCKNIECEGDTCSMHSMTLEEEIELAILLSKQEEENLGQEYLDANWNAMLMEDAQLALAIHESECEAALKEMLKKYKAEGRDYLQEENEASLNLALELSLLDVKSPNEYHNDVESFHEPRSNSEDVESLQKPQSEVETDIEDIQESRREDDVGSLQESKTEDQTNEHS